MTLDDIDALARAVMLRNASVKFGDPRYTCSINSQELMKLLAAVVAMLPVVREAESLCGPTGIDDVPRHLERAVVGMLQKLSRITTHDETRRG